MKWNLALELLHKRKSSENPTKPLGSRLHFAFLLLLTLSCWSIANAQIVPRQDSYTNTSTPTTNYGAKTLLDVDAATQTAYIQFDLSSIPSGASISQVTLKLYVNSVANAGSFNVDYVNGAWAENTISASMAPALGGTIVSGVSLTTADKNQFILIDLTSAVDAWLTGSQPNDGIALVANGTFNATFDSKENTTTSHPAELDIVYISGTITGVTTSGGSGLTGGGASGTVNLGLTTACAANQVLQWSGSVWVCSNAGTGTVTGITAGADLTGGGSGGILTLNLDTTKVPQLGSPNTFTGAQTISNTVSITASGGVQALGVNATGNTNGIQSNTGYVSGYAIVGTNTGTTGAGGGVLGQSSTPSGAGVIGNGMTGVLGASSVDFGVGVSGVSTSPNGGTGVLGTSTAAYGVSGVSPYHGVKGISTSSQYGFGVEGESSGTASVGVSGLVTAASGNNGVSAGVYGVGGASPSVGVLGVGSRVSTLGTNYTNTLMGMWGDSSGGIGVLGTSDSNTALFGINNSNLPTLSLSNQGSGSLILAGGFAVQKNGEVDVSGNNLLTIVGDPQCGSGTAAIGFVDAFSSCGNYALRGDTGGNLYINSSSTGWMFFDHNNAGLMSLDPSGNLSISGNLSKGGGSFKIDHPLDPANKYLYHSFVESPDMMNVYNGVVTLNANGSAWIVMPEYFEALNRDFRYQLTAMGGPQPNLYIAKQVAGNRFKIAGGKPNGTVSWQVTGIRHDAWANAHRIPVEVAKPEAERGHYLHPELYETAAEPRP